MPVEDDRGAPPPFGDVGTGEPVVLVTGSGAGGSTWHLQVPALVAAGYRVLTPDHREHSAGGADDLVADLVRLIERVRLGPCRLVGTSLGAHVVQELLLARPDLARQAVLLATRGRADALRAAMVAAERELLASGVVLPPGYAAVQRALQFLSPATLNDDVRLTDWLDLFEAFPPERATELVDVAADRLDAYRAIRVPTLVIGFGDDLIAPPHLGREVAAAIPGARYMEIADCAHYGYLERPEAVNSALLDFFAPPSAGRTPPT
ncbi:alpha/beta fold hydrolase [Saccharopolyspora gregorii]|uniref:alpha/beta fold hydrolase n=1 Tax=Saccharopolyspora gregorii TaxID=33914 RepID=UPI0021ACA269|nr:alpha/beta hydrolase [Saccharopolyspora gregorii]